MKGIFFGSLKEKRKTLRALATINEGITVSELAEQFDRMTDDQKERYIRLVVAEYEQFGGVYAKAK